MRGKGYEISSCSKEQLHKANAVVSPVKRQHPSIPEGVMLLLLVQLLARTVTTFFCELGYEKTAITAGQILG